MRELDSLLTAYLEHKYPGAPVAEQRAFESLVELEDPELLAYLMRRSSPANPDVAHVIAQLSATVA
jgi:succinate dehydrogenase flavin-adding protein (antitoxin of CptAB toxin-antitoxin module)